MHLAGNNILRMQKRKTASLSVDLNSLKNLSRFPVVDQNLILVCDYREPGFALGKGSGRCTLGQ